MGRTHRRSPCFASPFSRMFEAAGLWVTPRTSSAGPSHPWLAHPQNQRRLVRICSKPDSLGVNRDTLPLWTMPDFFKQICRPLLSPILQHEPGAIDAYLIASLPSLGQMGRCSRRGGR